MKKSLRRPASSLSTLAAAMNEVRLEPTVHREAKHAAHPSGPKPEIVHKGDKPKQAATPTPNLLFRGASRGT